MDAMDTALTTCKSPVDLARQQWEQLDREVSSLKQKVKEGKGMIVKVGLELQSLLEKIESANQVIIRINKVVQDSQAEIEQKTAESERLKATEADQLLAEVQSKLKRLRPSNEDAEATGETENPEERKEINNSQQPVTVSPDHSSEKKQTADAKGKQGDDGIKRRLKNDDAADDAEDNDMLWNSRASKKLKPAV